MLGCEKNNDTENIQTQQKQIIFHDDFNQKGDWQFSFADSLYVPNIFEAKIDSGFLTLTFSQNIPSPKGGITATNNNVINQAYLNTLNKVGFIVKIEEGSFLSLYTDSTYYARHLEMFYNGLSMSIPFPGNESLLQANIIEGKYDNGEVEVYIDNVKISNSNVFVSAGTSAFPTINFYVGYNDLDNKTRIDILKIDYVEIYTW
jgi:hypothetical protein